ncbi:MAG TPA: cation-efflux pump [Candidatus Kapabacteria bacterium]|nr:cation-efflux pump [Candidatus Kapabacteria bacterium]
MSNLSPYRKTDVLVPIDKLQVAWASVFVTLFLIAAKLVIGLSTGSLAILSQAADSGFDLVAVIITLLAVRVSSIPPDEDHPYGHGKFESLSALLQGLLLLGITAWIATSAISHLTSPSPRAIEVNTWSFAVLFVSIALDLWRARLLRRAGATHHSHALEASALNFYTDILSAVVALIGLALVKYAGIRNADDWSALVLAVFVALLSVRLSKRAIDGLTDRFSSTKDYEVLKRIVQQTTGIETVPRLRIRQAGPSLFVEASVTIDRVLPFAAIERIIADVERSIVAAFPNADVTVHWRPVRTPVESPFETLKVIAAEFGLMPHNVELSETSDGKIALDYHLEFRPGTALVEAERVSQQIQEHIRRELPMIGPIFAHLEEERSDKRLPRVEDIGPERDTFLHDVAFYAKAANRAVKNVREIHLFRVERERNLKLVLTLDLSSEFSLSDAHDIVTNVEEELRKRFPEITRIVIHANPV